MASELKKTASRCTTEMVQGTHTFVIENYGLKKGIGTGQFIQSGTFSVGGFDWIIRVYPDGLTQVLKDIVFFYLELTTKNTAARASFELKFFNHVTGIHDTMWSEATPRFFNSRDGSRFGPPSGGRIARDELEETPFVNGDRLTIDCVVNVIKDLVVSETAKVAYEIEAPPSDFAAQFAMLLEDPVGGDVTLNVGGEVFAAHKVVLATRSPVFKAQFFGLMKEKDNGMQSIVIEDMQPAVFKALLHFIYTDLLPEMDDLEGDDKIEIIRHLLVAADRYAMERLKLVCQSTLCKSLVVETVATTLALADQHHCGKLKEACIQFITPSNTMDDVVATRGYAELKRTYPHVFLEAFEKANKLRKIEISPSP